MFYSILRIVYFLGPCVEPMGVDNGAVVYDQQMTASSERDMLSSASFARIFNEFGAWVPEYVYHSLKIFPSTRITETRYRFQNYVLNQKESNNEMLLILTIM